jgi:L-fuconolactonase
MAKIDAHQHFWKYSPDQYAWISDEMKVLKQDFLASDLEPVLKKQGYDGCVAVQARQSLEENEFLIEQSKQNSIVKGIVGWVDLLSYHVPEELERYAAYPVMKGFRHIVQDEQDPNFLLGMEFVDGVKLLDLYDYTYDLLIFEKQMPTAIRFLEKLSGQQKIVLDHIGKPLIKERLTNNWKDSIKVMAEYPSLFVKISGLVTEADWKNWNADTFKPFLDIIVSEFGVDRIMLGSDWPVCLLAADSHKSVIDIASDYFKDFSKEDQDKVFGSNCANFYQIDL